MMLYGGRHYFTTIAPSEVDSRSNGAERYGMNGTTRYMKTQLNVDDGGCVRACVVWR